MIKSFVLYLLQTKYWFKNILPLGHNLLSWHYKSTLPCKVLLWTWKLLLISKCNSKLLLMAFQQVPCFWNYQTFRIGRDLVIMKPHVLFLMWNQWGWGRLSNLPWITHPSNSFSGDSGWQKLIWLSNKYGTSPGLDKILLGQIHSEGICLWLPQAPYFNISVLLAFFVL